MSSFLYVIEVKFICKDIINKHIIFKKKSTVNSVKTMQRYNKNLEKSVGFQS